VLKNTYTLNVKFIKSKFLVFFFVLVLLTLGFPLNEVFGSNSISFPPHIHDEVIVVLNSDEEFNLNLKDKVITNISSTVGDTIDITISVGDDTFLENIYQITLITNFAKKPSGMNNYFANNYNDYRQVGLSVYEWNHHRGDIKYSHDETISWNEPTVKDKQRTETYHDYVGFLLFDEKELLVTYHMNINKVMDQTQVTAQIIDLSNEKTNVVLPFTLEVFPKLEEAPVEEPVEQIEESVILKNNESQFNMKADKSTYENGNKVTITGQIPIQDFDPKKGKDIKFSITSPENEIILSGQFAPKSDGSFSFSTFAMDSSWKSDGDYVFEVKFNSNQEKISFFYDNSKVESIPLLEEPIVEESLLEEPIVEESLLEEPIVEESLLEEPIVEEQIEQIEEQPVNSTSNCGTGTELVNGICQVIQTEEKSSRGGGCLIATATYGSELAPQVQQLRELRENTLLNTESGTSFMNTFNDIYYTFSPTIADYERENPYFKEAVKLAITPMISSLSLMENANSESEVLGLGLSVIMLNIGMYLGVPAIVVIGIRKKF